MEVHFGKMGAQWNLWEGYSDLREAYYYALIEGQTQAISIGNMITRVAVMYE